MSFEVIRGGPNGDPNCLHGALPAVIDEFVKAHPSYQSGVQTVVDVAMVCGELIASGLFNSGNRQLLDQVLAVAMKEMRRSAIETLQTLDSKRRQ